MNIPPDLDPDPRFLDGARFWHTQVAQRSLRRNYDAAQLSISQAFYRIQGLRPPTVTAEEWEQDMPDKLARMHQYAQDVYNDYTSQPPLSYAQSAVPHLFEGRAKEHQHVASYEQSFRSEHSAPTAPSQTAASRARSVCIYQCNSLKPGPSDWPSPPVSQQHAGEPSPQGAKPAAQPHVHSRSPPLIELDIINTLPQTSAGSFGLFRGRPELLKMLLGRLNRTDRRKLQATSVAILNRIAECVGVVVPKRTVDRVGLAREIAYLGKDEKYERRFFNRLDEPETTKLVIQIIGWDFTYQDELVQALFAGTQQTDGRKRAHRVQVLKVQVLEIIGCPFTDSELITRLPDLFPDLDQIPAYVAFAARSKMPRAAT